MNYTQAGIMGGAIVAAKEAASQEASHVGVGPEPPVPNARHLATVRPARGLALRRLTSPHE